MSASARSRLARFRLVVFDWDGTLVDSEARIVQSVGAAIEALGLPERDAAAIGEIIGLGMPEAVEALYPGRGAALYPRFVAHYRERFAAAGPPGPLFPGARETVGALRAASCLLGIATGKSRRGLERELEATALAGLFDAWRCAGECASKPHPEMLERLMHETGAAPSETLVVGDTSYDMEMARNAGVAAVAVASGVHDRDRLLEFEPLALLASVAGLTGWLQGADRPAGADAVESSVGSFARKSAQKTDQKSAASTTGSSDGSPAGSSAGPEVHHDARKR